MCSGVSREGLVKMSKVIHIALCGGGTGGHVMPALNIFRELKSRDFKFKFWYIGKRDSLEQRLANSENIDFCSVRITYLKRHFSLRNMVLPFIASVAVIKAMIHLLKFRIDIVIGTGGFSAWPALVASSLINIPYVLQEQNNLPGLVTRLTAKRARKIYLGHERAKKHLKVDSEKLIVTGNPLAWNSEKISPENARQEFGLDVDRLTIFVSGGSGGASSINLLINTMKSDLIQSGYNIIWQTGKHRENIELTKVKVSKNLYIDSFFSQAKMFQAYAAANIAIVRCGEMTLAELAMAGLPSILVPFPFSADGHQETNGLAVQSDGAGIVIRDADLTVEKVSETIGSIMEPDNYKAMKLAMLARRRPDAARQIVDDIMDILR